MATLENPLKARLARGELAIGLGIKGLRQMDAGWLLRQAGWDWAFVDTEHSSMTLDQAAHLFAHCRASGVTPVVRVPGYEHWQAAKVLDAGAMGVVFPHVDSADHAAALVSTAKYPPQGHRSFGGPMAQLDYAALPPPEAMAAVNDGLVLIMMIESPQAVADADAIAAVEGVDVLLIGANDLSIEMGKPARFDDPEVLQAFDTVLAACKKHGKTAGFGGLVNPELEARHIGNGYRCLQSGSDASMLIAGSRAHLEARRAMV